MKSFKFVLFAFNLYFIHQINCRDSDIKIGNITWSSEDSWKNSFGSCGFKLPPNEYMTAGLTSKYMALPPGITNPNKDPLCVNPTCLLIRGELGSIVMRVGDTIGGNNDNVNVADLAFKQLADLNLGRVEMKWNFVDCKTHRIGPIETQETTTSKRNITPKTTKTEEFTVTSVSSGTSVSSEISESSGTSVSSEISESSGTSESTGVEES